MKGMFRVLADPSKVSTASEVFLERERRCSGDPRVRSRYMNVAL
jgi:hypothetical protein